MSDRLGHESVEATRENYGHLLLTGAGFSSTPKRRQIILELAQADGQPWTADQAESGWTDHMGEVMYGKQADVVERMLREMKAAAHDAGWAAHEAFLRGVR